MCANSQPLRPAQMMASRLERQYLCDRVPSQGDCWCPGGTAEVCSASSEGQSLNPRVWPEGTSTYTTVEKEGGQVVEAKEAATGGKPVKEKAEEMEQVSDAQETEQESDSEERGQSSGVEERAKDTEWTRDEEVDVGSAVIISPEEGAKDEAAVALSGSHCFRQVAQATRRLVDGWAFTHAFIYGPIKRPKLKAEQRHNRTQVRGHREPLGGKGTP
ncbi:uncharacterized protein LOC144819822 [Lissotriton helveticus]